MMGGRSAEKLLLGSVSSGADDDIRQATALAGAMVARWGMADEVGPVDLRQSDEHPFLGREIAQPRLFSQETAHEVDEAVHRLIAEAEQKAAAIIGEYRTQIEHLIDELERHENLDRGQIDACLGPARERMDPAPKPPLAAA